MPFTFAHPAVILPLNCLPKRMVSLTALVIGSTVPDFEYFIRMRVLSLYSHTIPGLFYFDVPLGLILFFIYLYVVKGPLIEHLPVYLKGRFVAFQNKPSRRLSRKGFWLIYAMILIGASSHLLWDAFTHPHGYFVEHISLLTSEPSVYGHSIYVYKVLQHLSTLVGFVIIGLFINKMPAVTQVHKSHIFNFWAAICSIAFFVVLARAAVTSLKIAYGDIIVTVIAGLFIGLTITSGYYSFWQKQRNGQ